MPLVLFGQQTDTLRFFSKSFNTDREVYVYTSKIYSYRSDSLKLPVIYILDGQHEWFVNPLLNTIEYLQYTHQIPAAIIVVIPLKNRVSECGIPSINDNLPLHEFITSELDNKIKVYGTNGYNVLIGHSFSASFSLYSMLKAPAFYKAVIANSPLDQMDSIMNAINTSKTIDKGNIFISVGGNDSSKDFYHRRNFEMLKLKYPTLFKQIHTYEADFSGHNAVPIVANPAFLTQLFNGFSKRYSNVAAVNDEYKLKSEPGPVNQILADIAAKSYIDKTLYPMEIPDINGIASRYTASGYDSIAIAIYEKGLFYFPKFYPFHLSIANLYLKTDKKTAIIHLNRAIDLVKIQIHNKTEQDNILSEIRKSMVRN